MPWFLGLCGITGLHLHRCIVRPQPLRIRQHSIYFMYSDTDRALTGPSPPSPRTSADEPTRRFLLPPVSRFHFEHVLRVPQPRLTTIYCPQTSSSSRFLLLTTIFLIDLFPSYSFTTLPYHYNDNCTSFHKHHEAPQRRHDDASYGHLHSLHGHSCLRQEASQVSRAL